MDTRTSFIENSNIFIDSTLLLTTEMAGNKLFATFSKKEDIEQTLEVITSRYTILFNKIFILESKDSEEFICTYNIDPGNLSTTTVLPNTILLHRKKDYNVLYSVNGLNLLVQSLNNGICDKNYIIPWKNYKNSIVLNNKDELRILETSIYKIVNL